jgi:putative lipoprotein
MGDAVGPTESSSVLLGTTWRLVSIEGREALAGVRVTAVFGDQNRVSGTAGCNAYAGSATLEGDRLKVGSMITTLMACGAEGVMPQEGAYLAALAKATAYRVVGTELQLGPAPGAATLVFRAE